MFDDLPTRPEPKRRNGRPRYEDDPTSRLKLVYCLAAYRRGVTVAALAASWGVAERTAYLWLRRARSVSGVEARCREIQPGPWKA